jgi:hypothetical protein
MCAALYGSFPVSAAKTFWLQFGRASGKRSSRRGFGGCLGRAAQQGSMAGLGHAPRAPSRQASLAMAAPPHMGCRSVGGSADQLVVEHSGNLALASGWCTCLRHDRHSDNDRAGSAHLLERAGNSREEPAAPSPKAMIRFGCSRTLAHARQDARRLARSSAHQGR